MKKPAVSLFLICCFSATLYAQQSSILPRHLQIGPRGMDTTAFAEIVVFRDSASDYNKYWFSVMIDNSSQPAAIINPGYCNIIRTKKTGRHTLYTKTDSVQSVEVDLSYGTRIYAQLKVSKENGRPRTFIDMIPTEQGAQRLKEFNGRTMVRYMSLTERNSEYITDYYPDSIRWRAGKALFHFVRPPSLEIIRSHIVMVFYAPELSATYSEFMTLAESKIKGIKDRDSFFKFAEGAGKAALEEDSQLVELSTVRLAHTTFPNSVIYYYESEDAKARNKGAEEHLHTRNVAVYFFLPDYNKRHSIYTVLFSERGMPSELSTKEELIRKFEYIWHSFRVSED